MPKTKVLSVHILHMFDGKCGIKFDRGKDHSRLYIREEYPTKLAMTVYDQALRGKMRVYPGIITNGWHARRESMEVFDGT